MGKVIATFHSEMEQLSESEKLVLYYLDNHIDDIDALTLVKLAEATRVSTTTVIRMTHKLGLEGFSDLKYRLKQMNQPKTITYSSFIQEYIPFLTETFDQIDPTRLKRMGNIIKQAPSIFIVSVGLTKTVGEYASQRLIQANKPAMHAYESHLIDLLPNLLKPNDVVIFISMSGETQTLIQSVKKLRFTGAQLFAFTNAADSTLSQLVHFNLSTAFPTESRSGYDITPRSPLFVLIDVLIEEYLRT